MISPKTNDQLRQQKLTFREEILKNWGFNWLLILGYHLRFLWVEIFESEPSTTYSATHLVARSLRVGSRTSKMD